MGVVRTSRLHYFCDWFRHGSRFIVKTFLRTGIWPLAALPLFGLNP
jgi:hypothetical protein